MSPSPDAGFSPVDWLVDRLAVDGIRRTQSLVVLAYTAAVAGLATTLFGDGTTGSTGALGVALLGLSFLVLLHVAVTASAAWDRRDR